MEKEIINRIQNVINFIEENIFEKIHLEDIAREALMSQSSFYSIFSSILGTTVKDYIRKRRLSLSAYDLIKSKETVLDIAIKYQYLTSESYSRAFKKLYGLSPKNYREKKLYSDVFPKVTLNYINLSGGKTMINKEMNKDVFVKNINKTAAGYILDIDIDHFDDINKKYSYEIGDKVLVEVPNRVKIILNNHSIDADVVRINNDEFAVVLKNQPIELIKRLSDDIITSMKDDFIFGETLVKLTVSIGITNFSVDSDNEEAIQKANNAMVEAKRNGRNQSCISE